MQIIVQDLEDSENIRVFASRSQACRVMSEGKEGGDIWKKETLNYNFNVKQSKCFIYKGYRVFESEVPKQQPRGRHASPEEFKRKTGQ